MALVVAVEMTSCEDVDVDGKQTPIKLDKSELTFSSAGGEQTVTTVNYNSWWISGGYEDKKYVNGVSEYVNYVYPTYNFYVAWIDANGKYHEAEITPVSGIAQ